MREIKVFFDSSALLAGLAAGRGAPLLLLSLVETEAVLPYSCEQVVAEVISQVDRKLPSCLPQFYTLFRRLSFILVEGGAPELNLARQLVHEKDAPPLAAAMAAGVDFFVTLDEHFLVDGLEARTGLRLLTPDDLLFELLYGRAG